MILQALNSLAQRERLTDDPDYEWRPVPWLVHVATGGRRLDIVDVRQTPAAPPGTKKKPRPVGKQYLLPREKPRTSNVQAFFLYDKAEYAFGADPGRAQDQKTPQRFQDFRRRVKECRDSTHDEAVSAIYAALEDIAAGRQKIALPDDVAASDLFAFVYEPDRDVLVTDRPKVRQYWKGLRAAAPAAGEQRTCLVSGQAFAGDVGNFPPTKRVLGGTASGIALVSFNKAAFESYGWTGNENAPISRQSAEACATALQRLVDFEPRDGRGNRLTRRNLRVSDDTEVCFWASQASGDGLCNALPRLMDPDPAEVGELYRSIWRGAPPPPADESAFYALVLSGQQGRIIVRDWLESTVARTQTNLARYFADLDIVRNTRPAKGSALPPQFALNLLLRSLAVRGERREIPAPLVGQMLGAALRGSPFPFSVLQRAIERERAEQGNDDWDSGNRRDARAALIKAVLNRRRRVLGAATNYREVKTDMDPNSSSEGYALGQMMAVLERIQQIAQPNVNATIVDRYFGSASASPRAAFVRLLKNARHHVRKAQDESASAGMVVLLDRLLDTLAEPFDPRHNGFPAYLDLNQQGLFILGYHQMRHWVWLSSEDRDAWERAHPDAPPGYLWRTGKAQRQGK